MRGALTVSLLRNKRKRIQATFQSASKRNKAPECKNRPKTSLKAVFAAEAWRINAC
jgi:hypothetical protein